MRLFSAFCIPCLLTIGLTHAAPLPQFLEAGTFAARKDNGSTDLKETTRYNQTMSALIDAFDDLCANSICEGDYSNWKVLSIACSVGTKTEKLDSCLWVLAASRESIAQRTGKVTVVSKKIAQCETYVRGIPFKEFEDQVLKARNLDLILPGKKKSISEQLRQCRL